jgi:hypothetical protein
MLSCNRPNTRRRPRRITLGLSYRMNLLDWTTSWSALPSAARFRARSSRRLLVRGTAFWKGKGGDYLFWVDLNKAFAQFCGRLRNTSGGSDNIAELISSVEKLRSWRRELFDYAKSTSTNRVNAPVLIRALVDGREDCYFVVDTGAVMTSLCLESSSKPRG